MKRKLTALLCVMLLGCSAMAEAPAPAPTPVPEISEAIQSSGSMSVTLNGETMTMEFDPDPLYSICRDGYVQASFFAYGANDLLYELYLTFPQDVQSGQTISPESSLMQMDILSGLYLYISTSSSEICSAATQYLTGAYPEGSSYSISFGSVSSEGTVSFFEGTIDAKLIQMDQNYNPTSTIDEFSASFSFSMDLGTAGAQPEPRQPEASKEPAAPEEETPRAESPYPPPEEFKNPYPPTPPSQLITPSNAQKI